MNSRGGKLVSVLVSGSFAGGFHSTIIQDVWSCLTLTKIIEVGKT